MKKFILLALTALVGATVIACADEKPISFSKLPEKAQTFVTEHFKTNVSLVRKDVFPTEYEVIFVNGDKIKFDSRGEWEEIECRQAAVPAAAVPAEIRSWLETNYPQQFIISIERDKRSWEIELDNRLDFKFNSRFQLLRIDD